MRIDLQSCMIRKGNVRLVRLFPLFCQGYLNSINMLGVLTKPDRIPTGEETNWVPFIRNEKETLQNNWYCVKQPSSSDIKVGITWSQARQREQDFFAMTPPWSELDAIYQKYLKTSNLVDRLSSILSDLISKRYLTLPSVLTGFLF